MVAVTEAEDARETEAAQLPESPVAGRDDGAPRRARHLASRLLGRLLETVQSDLRQFGVLTWGARARLRSYSIRLPGGRRRLHLRLAADGTALLLIDATDAIHLNPTAALLTRLALEGVRPRRAATALRRRFRQVTAEEAISATASVYALVDRLANAADACPACATREAFAAKEPAPFSVPAGAPYKADLALTYACNNACPHCYNTCRGGNRPATPPGPVLAIAQWRQVLRRLATIGIPHVVFTGGEPTLVDGLAELIRTANRLGLVTGLNTNGRRLMRAGFAAALHRAGLDHVQITLQSHDAAVHNAMSAADSFSETVAGVRNAMAAGLHTITNTTLTRRNLDGVCRTVDFLHTLGLGTFAMNGMIFAGGGCDGRDALPAESLAPVLARVRDRAASRGMRFLWYTPTEYCRLSPVELELGPRRCNAGEYSMCIDPGGRVLPCQSYDVPVGNILHDPWPRIWQSDLFRGFRRRTADPRAAGLPERCWACQELSLCGGGCKLERMHHAMAP